MTNARHADQRLIALPLLVALGIAALGLAGCGDMATLPLAAGVGPTPTLPTPHKTLLPTVNIAPAQGWAPGAQPTAAAGTSVNAFAAGLEHPRWLYVLPNGDVLVAESNAPPKPDDAKGIRGWLMGLVMKRAGAGVPSANRITLLRDADGNGVAETRTVFLENLASPIGMALIGNDLYVANTNAIERYAYTSGATRISSPAARCLVCVPMWRSSLISTPVSRWCPRTSMMSCRSRRSPS